MKKGKAPLKQKFEAIDSPSNDPSLLSLDDTVKKILDTAGLGYKFISDVVYRRNYGFNKEHWKPHKFGDNVRGVDPEGFLRRGDLILASQPVSDVEARRAKIRRKTAASQNYNSEKANELRALARDAGLDMKVHEGYEENE